MLCHETLHLFRAGAEWDGHHGAATTRYSQPGGVGRHIAQQTQIAVEAIGPGLHPTASLGGCPREVRTLLTCPLLLNLDIANTLPCIASQLDKLGLVPSKFLGALHTYSQGRDAYLTRLIAAHEIGPLDQQTPRDIAKDLANSALIGSSYDTWAAKYAAALGNTNHREGIVVRLQASLGHVWAAVESSAGGAVRGEGNRRGGIQWTEEGEAQQSACIPQGTPRDRVMHTAHGIPFSSQHGMDSTLYAAGWPLS